MPTRETAHSPPDMFFEFRYLEALPCGCVAADYGARFLALDVVAVEAKGPHCMTRHHMSGSLLGPDELAGGAGVFRV